MDAVTEYAYAKLNISLDVVSKMEDGYHNMLMVMQSASLCDEVRIKRTSGCGKILVSTNRPFLPRNERNIAGAAAKAFLSFTGANGWDISIDIKKRIPVCAGLGGGSSDAAAVLRGMNMLFETGLSQTELENIGKRLGSDVPYCISGGTCLASGRGDILTELPPMKKCFAVICKPNFSVSTPELFSKLNLKKIKCRPDTDGIIAALKSGNMRELGCRMYNIFEDVLPTGTDYIADIKGALYDGGALGAVMSGTGSAVFGLFDSEDNAKKAYGELKNRIMRRFCLRRSGKYRYNIQNNCRCYVYKYIASFFPPKHKPTYTFGGIRTYENQKNGK